jgi:hypothetical protein
VSFSPPDSWEGVAGGNIPQRWEAESRRIEAREEAYSRQSRWKANGALVYDGDWK